MTLINQIQALLFKELQQERKSKSLVSGFLLFAFLLIYLIVFSSSEIEYTIELKVLLFWILVYFTSMSSVSTVVSKDFERKNHHYLKNYFSAEAVFLSKSIYLSIFTIVTVTIIYFIFSEFMSFKFNAILSSFTILYLTIFTLSFISVLMSLILVNARNNTILFAIISFPLYFPVYQYAIVSTMELTLHNQLPDENWVILLLFFVLSFSVSYLGFSYLWEETE